MKIDDPEVRTKVAKNAAKRSGPGSWEAICGDLDEPDNKKYRHAMVVLARAGNEELDQALKEIKERLGDMNTLFVRRYNKAYREVEAALEKKDATVKKTIEEEAKPEFTSAEKKLIKSIKKELLEDPTVITYDKYATMVKPWSSVKGQLAAEMLGREGRIEIVKLQGVKAERVDRAAEARRAIIEKIPRSEIEEWREPGPEMWDIEVEIFYPIAMGVVTARIAPVADAIKNFGYIFDGRALPELVTMTTYMMLEKYEDKPVKLMTFYSAVVVKLSELQTLEVSRVAAHTARKKMEEILGIEDMTGDLMRQLEEAVIEEAT
jgi:hypothetical protein